jgi:hypothetical protein
MSVVQGLEQVKAFEARQKSLALALGVAGEP